MSIKNLLTVVLLILTTGVTAQLKVGNNPTTINANSVLEVESTNKGLLLPRVALTGTASFAPLSAHVAGMAVYNTATAGDVTPGYYYNNGTSWQRLLDQSSTIVATATNGLTAASGNVKLGGALIEPTTISGLTATNKLSITGTGVDALNVDGNTLSVDATNNRLGIGTTSPNAILNIVNDGGGIGAQDDLLIESYNPTGSAMSLAFLSSRGTKSVPTNLALNDNLGIIGFGGRWNGVNNLFVSNNSAISAQYRGNGTTNLTNMVFRTSGVDRLSIHENGNVGIGTTSPSNSLHIIQNGATSNIATPNYAKGITVTSNSPYGTFEGPGMYIENTAANTNSKVLKLVNQLNPSGDGTLVLQATTDNASTFIKSLFSVNSITGNVGIANDLPSQKLHVSGSIYANADDAQITIGDATNSSLGFVKKSGASPVIAVGAGTNMQFGHWSTGNINDNVASGTFSPKVVIASSGNMGIGTTTPQARLDVGALSNSLPSFTVNAILGRSKAEPDFGLKTFSGVGTSGTGDITNRLGIGYVNNGMTEGFDFIRGNASNDGEIAIRTSSIERVRINDNGNVGIGTAAATSLLSVNGTADKPGGGSWATFSDERVKKNIINYTKGLKEILAIRTVSFQYNDKSLYKDDGKTYVGVIAQEIEKILPTTINQIKTKEFNDLRQFDASELTYTLINAIKELKAESEILKAEIIKLKTKIKD